MLTGASASPIERWWFLPLSHSSRTAAWNFDLNLGGCNFFWQLTWKSSIGHWFTCSDKSLKHWLDEIFSPPPPQWPTKEDATHTLQRLFSFDNNLHILTLEALEGGGLEVEEPGFQCSRCGTEHFGWNIWDFFSSVFPHLTAFVPVLTCGYSSHKFNGHWQFLGSVFEGEGALIYLLT